MRSSRLLLQSRKKFTDTSCSTSSPTRLLPPAPTAPTTLSTTVPNHNINMPDLFIKRPATTLGLNQAIARNVLCKNQHLVPYCLHRGSLLERICSLHPHTKNATLNQKRYYAQAVEIPKTGGNASNLLSFQTFFRTKGIPVKESHACIQVDIPIYLLAPTLDQEFEPQDLRTPKVHVNKRTGNFVIPEHGVYGSWQELELLLKTWLKNRKMNRSDTQDKYPKLSLIKDSVHVDTKMYVKYKPVDSLRKKKLGEVLNNLNISKRNCDVEVLKSMGARVSSDLQEIVVPVRIPDGTLVGYRVISKLEEELQESNIPVRAKKSILPFPHGLHQTESEKYGCIVVGSLIDSIALGSKINLPIITLPDSGNLHPDHIPFLDQFQTIFIWLTNDVQGYQNAKLFAQKICERKCKIVNSSYPNPSTALEEDLDVKAALSEARSLYHESLTTFEQLRDNVYLEFVQSDEMMGVKWKRFAAMNNILGGFRRGELTIFSGRTGSGKTTFLSEWSLDLLTQGVNTLWCSFEVKNTRLMRVMMKQFSLINIDKDIQEFDSIADKFTRLPLYLTDFHGSQQIDAVMDAVSHAVYVHDITHIIVDNMQFMMGSSGYKSFDRFQVQDNTIEKFRKFATAHNCHVTLVIHPRKEDEDKLTSNSIFGGAKATQEADNVLLLQEEKSDDSFFKKKSIEVVKNRYAGNLGSINIRFCKPVNTFSRYAFEIVSNSADSEEEEDTVNSSTSDPTIAEAMISKKKKTTKLESDSPSETVAKPKKKIKSKTGGNGSKKGFATGDSKTKECAIPDVDTSFPSAYDSPDETASRVKEGDDRNVFLVIDENDK